MSTTSYMGASTNLLPNNAFVTTDAQGSFSFVGLGVTCPSGNPQLYFLALGGNPGQAPGTDNAAIQFLAPLGPCSGVTGTASVTLNEVSTIAAATVLQPFMQDGTHIGTAPGNLLGLTNAVRAYGNLLNPGSGLAYAKTPPANGGNGIVPQAELNTIADILAPCANSTSPAQQRLRRPLRIATTSGGTAPTKILAAALRHRPRPRSPVSPISSPSSPPAAPFQPTLPAAPNDFSIGITYNGNNLVQPGLLVLDAAGNVWTANCRSCATPGATGLHRQVQPHRQPSSHQYTGPGIHFHPAASPSISPETSGPSTPRTAHSSRPDHQDARHRSHRRPPTAATDLATPRASPSTPPTTPGSPPPAISNLLKL